jgi:hypothetical protein
MANQTIRVRHQQRSDTATNWATVNPVLMFGEIGYESNTSRLKIGDGTSSWNALSYVLGNTGADGTRWFNITNATMPAGARVNDIVLNGTAASITVGAVVLAVGEYSTITNTAPYTLNATKGNIRGAQGTNGTTPTLNVGTVTTVDPITAPTITDGGTATARTFNFNIPAAARIHQTNAAPLGTLGRQGDWHINTTTWVMSEKTGAAAWMERLNIRGGAGTNGTKGVAIYPWDSATALSNISQVTGSAIGDSFINTGTAAVTILGHVCNVGQIVQATSASAGNRVGTVRGHDPISTAQPTNQVTNDTWLEQLP